MRRFASLLLAFFLLTYRVSYAGSATWKSAPSGDNWLTATNWSPATVPNGPSDVATFAATTNPNVALWAENYLADSAEVNTIIFASDASPYTISIGGGYGISSARTLTISGAGIVNSSGVTQNFVNLSPDYYEGGILFTNSATAGTNNIFTNTGDDDYAGGGFIEFHDTSNAGTSTFINEGGNANTNGSLGGRIEFYDDSSADHATITNQSGLYYGGALEFYSYSTAGNAFIVNKGEDDGVGRSYTHFSDKATAGNSTIIVGGGTNYRIGGLLIFFDDSTAGNATLIAKGGTSNGLGGAIWFENDTHADGARVQLSGNGTLDISLHNARGLKLGSIEGEGLVYLGRSKLLVGFNNLSTKFGGVISQAGSLVKVGRGQLALMNANTYAGGTTVERGALIVSNTTGSATGSGPVNVEGGTLAGTGIISGAVTLGTHTSGGQDAVLSPGRESVGILTLQSTMTFMADGIYDFGLSSSKVASDQVVANGVTIDTFAYFLATDIATESLSPGTVFTVINNTSANAITGAFANLPDGGAITIGNNTFQANYEGGDGNDLTLMVLP